MRWLLLNVAGGLCNRLRAVVTGQVWAREQQRDYAVIWSVGDHFGARLNDIVADRFLLLPYALHRVIALCGGGYTKPVDLHRFAHRRLLMTSTGDQFCRADGTQIPEAPLLRDLTPSREVVQRVRSIRAWDEPVIGVMIRANPLSHAKTLASSPPSWFYRRMKEIRSTDPDVPFFLSTDCPDVSREVHEQFSNVLELPKHAAYNSREAIQDAMADLYLLAGTTYILGSYWSSFSEVARGLANHGGYETTCDVPRERWEERRGVTTRPAV